MIRPLTTVVALLLLLAPRADAVVREVPTQYPTIYDAVAATANGDTVYIRNGNYVECLIPIEHSITILGENRDSVRITTPENQDECGARPNYTALLLLSPKVVIKNVTVHNVYAFPYEALWGAIWLTSDSCVVESCNVVDNENFGIQLEGGNYNIIRDCLIAGNTDSGIEMWGGDYNIITNNMIFGNFCGIRTGGFANYNIIYQNNLIDNQANAEAWRCDTSNHWYLDPPVGGNYWDDYTGTDNDNDSFGDTPYVLPPGGTCMDMYPRMSLVPSSGDANSDGNINLLDVTFLVNYFKGIGEAPNPILSGDTNLDGVLNGLDVTFLVAYLTGRS